MTTRLKQLLSREPTQQDVHSAMFEADGNTDAAKQFAICKADVRRALALEVMLECAKMVCRRCDSPQYSLECFQGVWRHVNLAHTEYGNHPTTVECDAYPIHALIAEAEKERT